MSLVSVVLFLKDFHDVSEASSVSYPVCSQSLVRMLFRFALMLSGVWLVAHARRSRGVGGLNLSRVGVLRPQREVSGSLRAGDHQGSLRSRQFYELAR